MLLAILVVPYDNKKGLLEGQSKQIITFRFESVFGDICLWFMITFKTQLCLY